MRTFELVDGDKIRCSSHQKPCPYQRLAPESVIPHTHNGSEIGVTCEDPEAASIGAKAHLGIGRSRYCISDS